MKYSSKTFLKLKECFQIILLWILAFFFYIFLTYSIVDEHYVFEHGVKASDFLVSELKAVFFVGAFMGTNLFFLQEYVYPRFFQKYGILMTVLFQSILFLTVCFIGLLIIISLSLGDYIAIDNLLGLRIDLKWLLSFTLYSLVVHVFITLLRTFRRRLGKNYLKSLLWGNYMTPVVEYRVFMFLDMYASTTVAERVGHYNYSLLLQECFSDLSEVLLDYDAEIYQYVGDEAVLTWKILLDFDRQKCIDLYDVFSKKLEKKKDFYQNKFGIVPKFKASVNEGLVTVAEIGQIKTEIAYHGDVLSTAARVRDLCNNHQADFLITESFFEQLSCPEKERFTIVEKALLRGKKRQSLYTKLGSKNYRI